MGTGDEHLVLLGLVDGYNSAGHTLEATNITFELPLLWVVD